MERVRDELSGVHVPAPAAFPALRFAGAAVVVGTLALILLAARFFKRRSAEGLKTRERRRDSFGTLVQRQMARRFCNEQLHGSPAGPPSSPFLGGHRNAGFAAGDDTLSGMIDLFIYCLLSTSDAADEVDSVAYLSRSII